MRILVIAGMVILAIAALCVKGILVLINEYFELEGHSDG
jgi:hypothetical protein